MGSIEIIKPLSIVQSSVVNKSQQRQEKTSWEWWESNPGLLGVKHSVPCSPHPTPPFSLFTRNWTISSIKYDLICDTHLKKV